MNKAALPALSKSALSSILNRSGEVIYSSHETLKKGDIYLMGYNPGGAGFITIEDHIDLMLSRTTNSYLDESWTNGITTWGKGQAPLQKRIVWLLEQLEKDPRDVCASNLIFQTSKDAGGVPFSLAKMCWPVHEAVIEIVQPRLLIVFGNGIENSPYSFLKSLLGGQEDPPLKAGHGKWSCKGFDATIKGVDLYVAGLPHLSRYDPKRMGENINWLKTKQKIH